MTLWKVYTNDHPNGVLVHGNISEKQIRQRMREYIIEKRTAGLKLSEIVYTYGRVYTRSLP